MPKYSTYNGHIVGQVIADNGYAISLDPSTGRWWDGNGHYGYSAHFTGSWVCYTCGVLCDCHYEEVTFNGGIETTTTEITLKGE